MSTRFVDTGVARYYEDQVQVVDWKTASDFYLGIGRQDLLPEEEFVEYPKKTEVEFGDSVLVVTKQDSDLGITRAVYLGSFEYTAAGQLKGKDLTHIYYVHYRSRGSEDPPREYGAAKYFSPSFYFDSLDSVGGYIRYKDAFDAFPQTSDQVFAYFDDGQDDGGIHGFGREAFADPSVAKYFQDDWYLDPFGNNFVDSGYDGGEAPVDLALSATSFDENIEAGSVVGSFRTTDPDVGDAFSYSLVDGVGDSDNALFLVDGDQLKIINSPDFESKSSYSIRLETKDSGGLTLEKSFTLTVNDLPESATQNIDLWVSAGSFESPYYRFYADAAGAEELTNFSLDTESTYTFRRLGGAASHPFYISDRGHAEVSSNRIQITGDGESYRGITGTESFTLSFVPSSNDFSELTNLFYYCTAHQYMQGSLRLEGSGSDALSSSFNNSTIATQLYKEWNVPKLNGSIEPIEILGNRSIIFPKNGGLENWKNGAKQWSYQSLDGYGVSSIDSNASNSDQIIVLKRGGPTPNEPKFRITALNQQGQEQWSSDPFDAGAALGRLHITSQGDSIFVVRSNYQDTNNWENPVSTIIQFKNNGSQKSSIKLPGYKSIRETKPFQDGILVAGDKEVAYRYEAGDTNSIPYLAYIDGNNSIAWETEIIPASWGAWNPEENYLDDAIINAITTSGDRIFVSGNREVPGPDSGWEYAQNFAAEVNTQGDVIWSTDFGNDRYWVNNIDASSDHLFVSGGIDSHQGEWNQEDDYFLTTLTLDGAIASSYESNEPGFERIYAQDIYDNMLAVAGRDGNNALLNVYTISAPTFQVNDVRQIASGLALKLSEAPDLEKLNLYDGTDASIDLPDLQLTRSDGNVVDNLSVHWKEETNELFLIQTDSLTGISKKQFAAGASPFQSDRLAEGEYELVIDARSDGLVSASSGELIDGDGDGITGDAFAYYFTNTASENVISIGDTTRGSGQSLGLNGIAYSNGINGLPVLVSTTAEIRSISGNVSYDATAFDNASLVVGHHLPDDWTLDTQENDVGSLNYTASGATAITGADQELFRFAAVVSEDAAYGSSTLIEATIETPEDPSLSFESDPSLVVLAYSGDTTGNGGHSSLDASRIQRVVVGLDSGFEAFDTLAPTLIGDTTGNGGLSSLDASRVQQEVVGLPVDSFPEIPSI